MVVGISADAVEMDMHRSSPELLHVQEQRSHCLHTTSMQIV